MRALDAVSGRRAVILRCTMICRARRNTSQCNLDGHFDLHGCMHSSTRSGAVVRTLAESGSRISNS